MNIITARKQAQNPARVEGLRHAALKMLAEAYPDSRPGNWNRALKARGLVDRALHCGGFSWATRTEQQKAVLREFNAEVVKRGLNPAFLNY